MFLAYFCTPLKKRTDLVAQLVEQYTFNVWVLGSSPSQITGKEAIASFFMSIVDNQCIGQSDEFYTFL